MPVVTYFVAVSFTIDADGNLQPQEVRGVPSADQARDTARSMLVSCDAAIAYSRSGNSSSGEVFAAEVLAVFGNVSIETLTGSAKREIQPTLVETFVLSPA